MWVNRRTGQTVSGPPQQTQQQGGHWVNRRTGQTTSGQAQQGGFNPLSILSKLGTTLGRFGPSALTSLGLGEAPTFAPGVASTLGSIFSGEAPLSSIIGAGAETSAGSGLAGALGSAAFPASMLALPILMGLMMPAGESAKDLKADAQLMHSTLNNAVLPALRTGQPVDIDSLRIIGGVMPDSDPIEKFAFNWIKDQQAKGIQPPRDAQGNFTIPPQQIHMIDPENPGAPKLAGQKFTTALSLPQAHFNLLQKQEDNKHLYDLYQTASGEPFDPRKQAEADRGD